MWPEQSHQTDPLPPETDGRRGRQSAIYWKLPMKPSFSRSVKSPAAVKSASANLPGLAHPIDLADGRRVRSTTVICVRRGDSVVIAAYGQVSIGATVMKGSAKKIRRLYQDQVLAGFSGSTPCE